MKVPAAVSHAVLGSLRMDSFDMASRAIIEELDPLSSRTFMYFQVRSFCVGLTTGLLPGHVFNRAKVIGASWSAFVFSRLVLGARIVDKAK